jgi:hypothetical protein
MPLPATSGKSEFHKQHFYCKEYNKKTHTVSYYTLVTLILKKCFGSKTGKIHNCAIGYKTT